MHAAAPQILPLPLTRLREVLYAHYKRLSASSRRLRFMGGLGDKALLSIADHAKPDLTLAIEIDGAHRAILELFRTSESHAEIGISIEDAYQGRGYGRALFHRAMQEARIMGLAEVDVHFSRSNVAIQKLCQHEGGIILSAGSECIAYIPITENQS